MSATLLTLAVFSGRIEYQKVMVLLLIRPTFRLEFDIFQHR
jgi:hypothetical protein